MSFKQYVITLFVVSLLIVSTAVAFNWMIDPYAIFSTQRVAGLNKAKPFAGDRGRTSKLYQVQNVRPAGLIGGNSRSEMGLDPNHVCWPEKAKPVYNTAIPGTSVYAQTRYIQHGIAAGKVTTVIQSLDFLDFLQPSGAGGNPQRRPLHPERRQGFLVDPYGQPSKGLLRAQIRDYAGALLALDATAHSVFTVLQQRGRASTRTAHGFNPGERIYEPIIRNEGLRVLFAQKNREVMDRLTSRKWTLTNGDSDWSADFEALRRMILYTKAHEIDLKLFISPYHAEYLASIEIAGMWLLFEDWKRKLATLAKEHGVPLWDFALFDRYSTETIESVHETRQRLDWFWEPAHYRRELGDLILTNIWRQNCPAGSNAVQYGSRIDELELVSYLARQRIAKNRYMVEHPSVIRRLTQFINGN